jgi:hypothetical protein
MVLFILMNFISCTVFQNNKVQTQKQVEGNEKRNYEKEESVSGSAKLQAEYDKINWEVCFSIQQSSKEPKMKYDTIDYNKHLIYYDELLALKCYNLNYPNDLNFDIEEDTTIMFSTANNPDFRDDGQHFCFSELKNEKEVVSKIFFKRTEGGHSSDEIYLLNFLKDRKTLYTLTLNSYYGKEGYSSFVSSKFISINKIKRIIKETYGSLSVDEDLQPRSITTQEFQIFPTGEIKLLSEKIVNYNLELYGSCLENKSQK